jgi:NADH-quinone oxidoreductase subunit E/NADP-reducing hydrogenase subunit HndA
MKDADDSRRYAERPFLRLPLRTLNGPKRRLFLYCRKKTCIRIHGGKTMAKLEWSAVKKILEICQRYKDEPTPLMMILSDIQSEYGYIPLEVQEIVSDETGISVAEIYGVVTFYSFFSLTPKGKYVIGCCLGTACYVKGAQKVIDRFSEILKIKPGETTKDGLFTLDALRCIGACGIAPAISINGTVYPKVEVSQVPEIIKEYKAKEGAA